MSEQEKPNYRPETLALHAGYEPRPHHRVARGADLPDHVATSSATPTTPPASSRLKEFGNIYTRIMNPTMDVFEKRIAALEGGVGGAGARVRAGRGDARHPHARSGRRRDRLRHLALRRHLQPVQATRCPRLGITASFVDAADFDGLRSAITPKTKALYAETLGNPKLDVLDIETLADDRPRGRACRSSSTTPRLARACAGPLAHGANIVIHSADQVHRRPRHVDRRRHRRRRQLPLGATGSSPSSPIPTPATTALSTAEAFGNTGLHPQGPGGGPPRPRAVRCRPFNAFLRPSTALETLHLRMRASLGERARRSRSWLQKHPRVAWVNYPGLEEDPCHPLARKYLPTAARRRSSRSASRAASPAGKALIDWVKLFSLLANIGDARVADHPPGLHDAPAALARGAAQHGRDAEDLVRLSVGIEHPDDILADLDRSLGAR